MEAIPDSTQCNNGVTQQDPSADAKTKENTGWAEDAAAAALNDEQHDPSSLQAQNQIAPQIFPQELKRTGEIYTPRFDHAVTRKSNILYLFGGDTGNFYSLVKYLNDFYQFDSSTGVWRKVRPSSTSPCRRAGCSLVSYKKRIHLFGGVGEKGLLSDLWTYDPKMKVWGQRKTSGAAPSPRCRHTALIVGDEMYVYGGSSQDKPGAVFALCMATKRWRELGSVTLKEKNEAEATPGGGATAPAQPSRPAPRFMHSAAAYRDFIYIFGGVLLSGPQEGEATDEVWRFDTRRDTWELIETTVSDEPVDPLAQPVAEVLPTAGDEASPSTTSSSTCPRPASIQKRASHASALVGNLWVIHGGVSGVGAAHKCMSSVLADGWALDLDTHVWRALAIQLTPCNESARWGHQLTPYSKARQRCMLMTGGATIAILPLL